MSTQTQVIEKEAFSKVVENVIEISADQIRSENRDYNPSEWDRTIDRYLKYKDCKFYKAVASGVHKYDRYFAVYTIPEGITFFGSVSYGSCVHNGGFVRIVILENGEVLRFLLKDAAGNEGRGGNDKENRKVMARNSQRLGAIFSNNY